MWLVYFPGFKQVPKLDHLEACGIARAWYGYSYDPENLRGPESRGTDVGPDKTGGKVCVLQSVVPGYQIECSYRPEEQVWFPCRLQSDMPPAYWVGWYKDNPPVAAGMLREDRIGLETQGYPITLNGQQWIVPVALGDSSFVPRVAGIDWNTGQWNDEPDARFAGVLSIAEKVYDWIIGDAPEPPRSDLRDWATGVLQSIYRINKFIVGGLNLFKDDERRILHLHIDANKILKEIEAREASKKKTGEESSIPENTPDSEHGGTPVVNGQATGQPMALADSGQRNSSNLELHNVKANGNG